MFISNYAISLLWLINFWILSGMLQVCFTFNLRGGTVGVVDVLCYRDYTREGKRVNTHSLLIKGVKLPTDIDKNGVSDDLCS